MVLKVVVYITLLCLIIYISDYINEIELLNNLCSNFFAPRILRVVSEI